MIFDRARWAAEQALDVAGDELGVAVTEQLVHLLEVLGLPSRHPAFFELAPDVGRVISRVPICWPVLALIMPAISAKLTARGPVSTSVWPSHCGLASTSAAHSPTSRALMKLMPAGPMGLGMPPVALTAGSMIWSISVCMNAFGLSTA